MPDHYRLLPFWAPFVIVITACVPIVGVAHSSRKSRWLAIEGVILKLVAIFTIMSAVLSLVVLVRNIILGSPQATGLELLTSSMDL